MFKNDEYSSFLNIFIFLVFNLNMINLQVLYPYFDS